MTTSGTTVSTTTAARPDRTVLDRLLLAGISETRARDHLQGGWVLVDGKKVSDPSFPAVPPSKVELRTIMRYDR